MAMPAKSANPFRLGLPSISNQVAGSHAKDKMGVQVKNRFSILFSLADEYTMPLRLRGGAGGRKPHISMSSSSVSSSSSFLTGGELLERYGEIAQGGAGSTGKIQEKKMATPPEAKRVATPKDVYCSGFLQRSTDDTESSLPQDSLDLDRALQKFEHHMRSFTIPDYKLRIRQGLRAAHGSPTISACDIDTFWRELDDVVVSAKDIKEEEIEGKRRADKAQTALKGMTVAYKGFAA